MKVAASIDTTHNLYDEAHWVSCLRENLTSSSEGEGLETGRTPILAPRQSFTRQRMFVWLLNYRRHSKDYETLTRNSEALIQIAMIHLLLKRLA